MNYRYQGLFEDWEIGVATNLINKFRNQWKCLEHEDFDDLLQECLIQWHFSKDGYDSSIGANEQTFMARIVANKLNDIVREQTNDKRKISHQSDSLDQPLGNNEEHSSLSDIIPSNTDLKFHFQLKFSIEYAMSLLTTKQQELCLLIQEGYSRVDDLSKALGIERTTVYREIKRIRKIFENEGLKIFLK